VFTAPAPAGGFTTTGRPTSATKARARQPSALEHRFHRRLVAEIPRRFDAQAPEAEMRAHFRERHLQLLERPDDAIRRADRARELARGLGDLRRIHTILDPPMPRDDAAKALRQALERILADEREPHSGQARRALDETQRRFHEEWNDEIDDQGRATCNSASQ
jgi:hypothetical protein